MVEVWDLYDENKRLTGETIPRGEKIPQGRFHLTVDLFFLNSKGELLLQKRSAQKKKMPNAWCAVGGAAWAGEDGKKACIRECEEEMGFRPNLEKSRIVVEEKDAQKGFIRENYLIFQDVALADMRFQPEEVQDAQWILPEKIGEDEDMWWELCVWGNWLKVYPYLLLESMRLRIPRGVYRHYKGNCYQVEGLALHSESLEPMVIYRALYGAGETWVRPASMWHEMVDVQGKMTPRFAKMEEG